MLWKLLGEGLWHFRGSCHLENLILSFFEMFYMFQLLVRVIFCHGELLLRWGILFWMGRAQIYLLGKKETETLLFGERWKGWIMLFDKWKIMLVYPRTKTGT